MEFYSVIKIYKVLIHVATCISLETLCQVKEEGHKWTHSVELHSYEMSSVWKSIETESRLVAAYYGEDVKRWK